MTDDEDLRLELLELQIRIAEDRATFDEELKFVRSIVIQLRDDRDWIQEVADNRQDRILALEAQLAATQLQLEALLGSSHKGKARIGNIAMTFLTGVGSIAGMSGFSLRDVVESPSSAPLSAIVVTLSPEECSALGLEPPQLPADPVVSNLGDAESVRSTGALDLMFGTGSTGIHETPGGVHEDARTDDSEASSPGGSVLNEQARTDDSLASLPGQAHDELHITDSGGGPAIANSTNRQWDSEEMVLDFLRARFDEQSDPVLPEAIAAALPLEIGQVQSILGRLLKSNIVEGPVGDKGDFPAVVTGLR